MRQVSSNRYNKQAGIKGSGMNKEMDTNTLCELGPWIPPQHHTGGEEVGGPE